MTAPFGSDPWLDARLRNVPLPAGMLARLKQLGRATDESADASASPKLFRPNQPVPIGPSITDDQMDALLGDVELPPELEKRLRRISQERRPRVGGRKLLAMAAALLVAASLSIAWKAGLIDRGHPEAPSDRALATNQAPPDLSIAASSPEEGVGGAPVEFDDLLDLGGDQETQQEIENLRWQLAKQANLPIYVPNDIAVPGPEAPPRLDKKTVFASDRTHDRLPELETVAISEAPRGIIPPMVPGYDFRFRARYGQHPFVVPAMHKELQSLHVPLVTRSTNYLHAWQALADRKLLSDREVLVEELLAAVDYGFEPAAAGALRLAVAGGPSPLSVPGMKLLQVGVQAGSLIPTPRSGTSLAIMVDTSLSMRRGGRLAMVRRALADLVAQLGDDDRLTLISSSDESRPLVEAFGRKQLAGLLAAIKSLEPAEGTNLGAGLETAFAAAGSRTATETRHRRVVLITDGLTDLPTGASQRIKQLVSNSAALGVSLDVLQVGVAPPDDADRLQAYAHAGNGELRVASDADSARFALLESLMGQSQTVAKEAALKITFNPKVVVRYRLIGHECVSLTGSTGAPIAVELRAGEAATALFEVQLNPKGGNDVATVVLSWMDPGAGALRSATQHVGQASFTRKFADEPASLQTATIVAGAAEVLRGSYFTGGNRSLAKVLDLASQASPAVVERPSMKSFLSFVTQAEKVRLRGTGH
jgi:Ca-activated chloride channel family protein